MKNLIKPLEICLNDKQNEQFKQYYHYLLEENKKYNLTGLTTKEDIYIKHFYDSLTLLKTTKITNSNLLDIGSGAGFPGIPLKIATTLNLTMIEAQKKKALFLNNLLKELNLEATVINKRVEDLPKKYLNSYDIVTARAVASLQVLSELALPFVKKGGYFIAMKSGHYQNELNEAKRGIMILGSEIEEVIEFSLPEKKGKRALIVIKKLQVIDGYPRPYQLILKKPLGSDENE